MDQPVPIEKESKTLFGKMKGTIPVVGNILDPIDEAWDACHSELLQEPPAKLTKASG